MNIHIEMPSGCQSRGYDPDRFLKKDLKISTEENAFRVFDLIVAQVIVWKGFQCDVVMLTNSNQEVLRRHVEG